MPTTFAYTVSVDNGSAPCAPDADLLTLAICKPQIRETAQLGDRVIGISARNMRETPAARTYPAGIIVFAAVVDKRMPWREYASRAEYEGRKDLIYRYHPNHDSFSRRKDATVHLKPGDLAHDVKAPVLLSSDFRYFGRQASIPLSALCPSLDALVKAKSIARPTVQFDETSVTGREDKIKTREDKLKDREAELQQHGGPDDVHIKLLEDMIELCKDKIFLIRYKKALPNIDPLFRDLWNREAYTTSPPDYSTVDQSEDEIYSEDEVTSREEVDLDSDDKSAGDHDPDFAPKQRTCGPSGTRPQTRPPGLVHAPEQDRSCS